MNNSKEEKEIKITPKDRERFTKHLSQIATNNNTWKKVKEHIENAGEPMLALADIMAGLLFLAAQKSDKMNNIRQKLYRNFKTWLKDLFQFPEKEPSEEKQKEKIEMIDIDLFCEFLIRWCTRENTIRFDLSELVPRLYQIFRINYEMRYFTEDLKDMQQEFIESGVLTSFTEFKKRKKAANTPKNQSKKIDK